MKFLHTGDLHIGKTVNGFSMLEDQKKALTQMVEIAKREKVQAFVIAGDVYERAIPTAEAVLLFNDFLSELHELSIEVLCISGNHDSPERLSFLEQVLEKNKIHMAGVYENSCKQIELQDEYGAVVFVLMPYVKPYALHAKSCDEVVEKMLQETFEHIPYDESKRYVMVTHYFVVGNNNQEPELSDSENISYVGGLDMVSTSYFERFTYTALGHIHKPQKMGKNIYYAGSPLPYSFSECEQEKGIWLVELKKEGVDSIVKCGIKPLHGMRKIKGDLINLISDEIVNSGNALDYMHITLTDDVELIDPIGTLRNYYPNVMQLVIEKYQVDMEEEYIIDTVEDKSLEEIFADFYFNTTNREMDETRSKMIKKVFVELEND